MIVLEGVYVSTLEPSESRMLYRRSIFMQQLVLLILSF